MSFNIILDTRCDQSSRTFANSKFHAYAIIRRIFALTITILLLHDNKLYLQNLWLTGSNNPLSPNNLFLLFIYFFLTVTSQASESNTLCLII